MPEKIKIEHPPIRWKRIKKDKILMTNDLGGSVIIKEKDFKRYINKKIKETEPIYQTLQQCGFIKNSMDFNTLFDTWKNANSYLFRGPSLHILVLTLRCDHKCIYCQSQAVGENDKSTDMSFETAKRAVDMCFNTTSQKITIEFQGGEPLLNWDVLKKTVEYIKEKEKNSDKIVTVSVVTNFSYMDEEKADFLLKNEISICSSLDGPEDLHNKNRILSKSNSYKNTVRWIKFFYDKYKNQKDLNYRIFKPSALLTVSRYSLEYPKEIIDEYVNNGLDSVFIRPLSPIGFAKKHWDIIGYTPEEFFDFYRKALYYILDLNLKGKKVYEKTCQTLAFKTLAFKDAGYADLRCPCGAGIGQVAYNFNGDIYTCDEGRMLGWGGSELFKIGNLYSSTYSDIINAPSTKMCALVSNLEAQPKCFRCVYMPFCGVCPVINQEENNNPWGNNVVSYRCKIITYIMDEFFKLLDSPKYSKVIHKWIEVEK